MSQYKPMFPLPPRPYKKKKKIQKMNNGNDKDTNITFINNEITHNKTFKTNIITPFNAMDQIIIPKIIKKKENYENIHKNKNKNPNITPYDWYLYFYLIYKE